MTFLAFLTTDLLSFALYYALMLVIDCIVVYVSVKAENTRHTPPTQFCSFISIYMYLQVFAFSCWLMYTTDKKFFLFFLFYLLKKLIVFSGTVH